jgi:invasion protein IalB
MIILRPCDIPMLSKKALHPGGGHVQSPLTSLIRDGMERQQKTNDGFEMTRFLAALPLFVALAVVAPAAAFAQTAPVQTAPVTEPATPPAQIQQEDAGQAPAAKVEDLLSLGSEEETEVGKPYTRETIGAWEMRCIRMAEGEEPCQMYQLLDDGQGSPVAEVSLFRLPDGGKAVAGATVIVPLETSLTDQFTVSIDGGKARRYPYAFCNPVGCYVRLGLTTDDVAAFKRGNKAVMTIVPALAPDQKVELALSLEGFTASFDKVSILEQ